MNRYAQILQLCIGGCPQWKISEMLGWKEGATGTMMKRMLSKKLVIKTDLGMYKTSKLGLAYFLTELADWKPLEYYWLDLAAMNLIEKKNFGKDREKWIPFFIESYEKRQDRKDLTWLLKLVCDEMLNHCVKFSDLDVHHPDASDLFRRAVILATGGKMPAFFGTILKQKIEHGNFDYITTILNICKDNTIDEKTVFDCLFLFALSPDNRVRKMVNMPFSYRILV
ncbi:protein of unknown function [Nitrosotalea devaniterrae]|uniref:Uncharacterized protein n=1 Tax=Nitrosotalea devaniterrae TaxID=1078905 RepID=A0A128A5N2_9ARCH|nr:protein of unknown function [Candidatus Nitrosotalea devanaterra]